MHEPDAYWWNTVDAGNNKRRHVLMQGNTSLGWIDDRRHYASPSGYAIYWHGEREAEDLSHKLIAIRASITGAKSVLLRKAIGSVVFPYIPFPWSC